MKKKQYITLIEIIVVMFFISIITGVIAYNIKGSLDEGKAFQTLETKKQLKSILELSLNNHTSIPQGQLSEVDLLNLIGSSPFVSHPKKLLKDGWGHAFVVHFDGSSDTFTISSEAFNSYSQAHPNSLFHNEDE